MSSKTAPLFSAAGLCGGPGLPEPVPLSLPGVPAMEDPLEDRPAPRGRQVYPSKQRPANGDRVIRLRPSLAAHGADPLVLELVAARVMIITRVSAVWCSVHQRGGDPSGSEVNLPGRRVDRLHGWLRQRAEDQRQPHRHEDWSETEPTHDCRPCTAVGCATTDLVSLSLPPPSPPPRRSLALLCFSSHLLLLPCWPQACWPARRCSLC